MAQQIVSAIEHYEGLLAEHYGWMAGEFQAKVEQQKELLTRLGVAPAGASAVALDLGCGNGFQSVALAEMGFRVTAIDANRLLLDELKRHAAGRGIETIETVEADLAALERTGMLPATVEAAVCMGDTLSHLPSVTAVAAMFQASGARLKPGGSFVVSFRDLSQPLEGLGRFLPVRSDDTRIMTCFLEYEPETVVVTDLIYIRETAGWKLRKSAYRKLRLKTAEVKAELALCGLEVESEEAAMGMVVLACRKTR